MLTGECKFFNDRRGYGFLSRDDGEQDAFVHFTGLADPHAELVEGAKDPNCTPISSST
jgi:CspA family cold shock protein